MLTVEEAQAKWVDTRKRRNRSIELFMCVLEEEILSCIAEGDTSFTVEISEATEGVIDRLQELGYKTSVYYGEHYNVLTVSGSKL